MDKQNGKLENCLLQPRENEVIFVLRSDGTVVAHLDGYAIIPIEVFKSLS